MADVVLSIMMYDQVYDRMNDILSTPRFLCPEREILVAGLSLEPYCGVTKRTSVNRDPVSAKRFNFEYLLPDYRNLLGTKLAVRSLRLSSD